MKKYIYFVTLLSIFNVFSQDLSEGYIANDLIQRPMQPLAKPDYLKAAEDPSFPATVIRRISEADPGRSIVPMYNTIQAWNADESLLIVYAVGSGHILLNGTDYSFIRNLSDIRPDDLEAVFWHFSDPDILFYMDNNTDDLVRYNVNTQAKTVLANMRALSGCASSSGLSSGNDVQMMSWDSDVFAFRCGNNSAYYYRISTGTLTEFNISDINYTAPMPFPSGNLFYHNTSVYDANGDFVRALNIEKGEHSCLGKLSNGDDAYFAISFAEGPNGGCLGTLVAHNATTGNCFAVTPTEDYGYSKSGTHISALAHKNSEGGWVAVSSMGYEKDGVEILDQELFIAKVDEFEGTVYRVAHHRSDEDDIDYWGEPHVTISPTGTRLLFGSDWSGTEDGISVDAYVAELQAYNEPPNEECTSEQIIPEYRLDGVWSSGQNELTVAYDTEVMFSMLPDGIDLTVEFPDGTVVGDNYNIGDVTPANNGPYLLTSAEGCTTIINLTVEEEEEEECQTDQIIPEYRLDGLWSSGQNDLTVGYGTEVMFSMLPDGIDLTVEFPNGTVVGDNYNIGAVTPANNGPYLLTSSEGCTTIITLTVEEEEEDCAPGQIIPEYRLDGVWSSGQNELTVAYGTEVMFSMLPDNVGLSVEFPDGTVVGDNYNIGAVTPANNGSYILTSSEGCTTIITLTVEEEEEDCAPGQIIPEYRLDGVWSSGQNELTVAYGTEVMFSMLPNNIGVTVEFPDGTIVGDDYNIGNVTPANNGLYLLTSSEGCTTVVNLTVEEDEEGCPDEQIIPEYRLDGVWSSGQNELTVAYGTEVMFSMLPNNIGVTVEFPDGTIVGDDYNIGAVTPANSGPYLLTSSEGCTTIINLTVEEGVEGCAPGQIIPEYRLDGVWSSGLNDLTVDEGTEVMFSMLPNRIAVSIEFPDGTVVGDDFNIGAVTPADNGAYVLTSAEGCQTTINLTVTPLENEASNNSESDAISNGAADTADSNDNAIPIIYPNPTKGVLNIDLKSFENQQLVVTVFNSTGQVVSEKVFDNDHRALEQLSLNNLPDGLYYLILQSTSNRQSHSILVSRF